MGSWESADYIMSMWLLFLLVAYSGVFAAHAASLDQVRVFTGQDHARVLVVTTGAPRGLQVRSSPAVGSAPARCVLVLQGLDAGRDGDRNILVDDQGVQELRIQTIGDDVQLTVHLDAARLVRAEPLGEGALLLELRLDGADEDPDLPTGEQLRDWLDGVSLVRAAGGAPENRTLVVVDAGHGGFDHGAVGLTGTREADIALQIALRTASGLEERLGIEVILTRSTDVFVPLRERAALANQADADLFLSIHANAAPGPTAWGIETYSLDTASDAGAARVAARENALVREQDNHDINSPLMARLQTAGTNRLSRELAGEVQTRVIDTLRAAYGDDQIRDLGTKTALFYVLVSTRMPAILFEASFVSNGADERRLRTPQFQQATADGLVAAVGAWLDRQGEGG